MTATRVLFHTTVKRYFELCAASQCRRWWSSYVKIDRQALLNLLYDHFQVAAYDAAEALVGRGSKLVSHTTADQYGALCAACNHKRRWISYVKVDRQALENLLYDHFSKRAYATAEALVGRVKMEQSETANWPTTPTK